MLTAASAALRRAGSKAHIVALEPSSSPVPTTGIVPPLLTADAYDEARTVDEDEARRMAPPPARREGVFAGISSALNAVGAIRLARELGDDHTVVTVAPDTGPKYLTGDLFK